MRRALDVEHGVRDGAAEPRERLLQLGLVVDVARERVLDPRLERVDDRPLDVLEAVLEVDGGDRRLEQRGEHVAVAREPLDLLAPAAPASCTQPLAEPELARDDRAARTRDDVRAHLRHPPLVEVREAVVERAGDRELEHRVAEKLEPLVRLGALGGPGRVREDGRRALGRQRVDQLPEGSVLTGAR